MMDWDDARVFLAVARNGSLRAAGRSLGLSQPTVGRRLSAFETSFGGPALFDRLPDGLRLNSAGDALLPAVEQIEIAALAVERRRAAASPVTQRHRPGLGRRMGGELSRPSSRPHRSQAASRGHYHRAGQSQQTANLARREADLAVRHHPPEGVRRRLFSPDGKSDSTSRSVPAAEQKQIEISRGLAGFVAFVCKSFWCPNPNVLVCNLVASVTASRPLLIACKSSARTLGSNHVALSGPVVAAIDPNWVSLLSTPKVELASIRT